MFGGRYHRLPGLWGVIMHYMPVLLGALLVANAPLPPGRPAGVEPAQQHITLMQAGLVTIGIAAALGGIGVALGGKSAAPTSTSP
jgi:hypothetical protein